MPILESDIDFHLSGGATNSDVNLSLGGVISSTQIIDATLHNLFDIVSSAEASAGDVEYRCVYIKNNHATLTLQNAVVWISVQTPSPDTGIAIALAGEGINGTAETIADESTAPVDEVFSQPATEVAALSIGDIPAQQHQAIWIRRSVNILASAYNNDSVTIRVKGDTAA